MKRAIGVELGEDKKMKKVKLEEHSNSERNTEITDLDENLLFEVFKHVDSKTLGMASCVNKMWNKTAQDERLWELICMKHQANMGYGNRQMRSVVLALGGFRRLHSQYLWPLSKQRSPASPAWAALAPMMGSNSKAPSRLGRDAMHLSLSLLSIKYFEKMDFSKRR